MHALDILGDPVRRRILELLADGQASAGELGRVIHQEFGISQPAVSQHLRVLREFGFTTVHPDGTRRLYAIEPAQLAAADEWFDAFRGFWQPRLDALGTELARGRRARRPATPPAAPPPSAPFREPAAPFDLAAPPADPAAPPEAPAAHRKPPRHPQTSNPPRTKE
jgi:DNA-binding transcriptional ArsR family regulator